jgi:LCP family protein required for cell wall assembly
MGQVVLLRRTVGRTAGKHRDPARRRRWITVSVAMVTVLVVLIAGAWLALERAVQDFDRGVERFASPFRGIPEVERPSRNPAAPEAIDLLLLGSDTRVSVRDSAQWKAAARHTDAIMLVHVPQDRRGAYFLSIPRDSWVDIPGHGKGAIGDALGHGGPQLMVRAVERLTQQRIEHVAIVDFTGFRQVTDAVGGVTITVPASERGRSGLAPGQQRMDGAKALEYVRRGDGVRGAGSTRCGASRAGSARCFRRCNRAGSLPTRSRSTGPCRHSRGLWQPTRTSPSPGCGRSRAPWWGWAPRTLPSSSRRSGARGPAPTENSSSTWTTPGRRPCGRRCARIR